MSSVQKQSERSSAPFTFRPTRRVGLAPALLIALPIVVSVVTLVITSLGSHPLAFKYQLVCLSPSLGLGLLVILAFRHESRARPLQVQVTGTELHAEMRLSSLRVALADVEVRPVYVSMPANAGNTAGGRIYGYGRRGHGRCPAILIEPVEGTYSKKLLFACLEIPADDDFVLGRFKQSPRDTVIAVGYSDWLEFVERLRPWFVENRNEA